jgi:hypothetical protein
LDKGKSLACEHWAGLCGTLPRFCDVFAAFLPQFAFIFATLLPHFAALLPIGGAFAGGRSTFARSLDCILLGLHLAGIASATRRERGVGTHIHAPVANLLFFLLFPSIFLCFSRLQNSSRIPGSNRRKQKKIEEKIG